MHTRSLTKAAPAPAFNVEQVLFVGNGIVALVNSVITLGNSVIGFVNNLSGFFKPEV